MIQDLRSIQIIETVASKGTVSAAADELGISQPALTKRIQAIESLVGLRLLERDAKGATLTSNGEFFLQQSKKLVLQARDFSRRLVDFREGHGGELRIGLKTGLDDVFFTDVMLRLINDNPRALIEVDIDTTPGLVRRVEAGELDLVLVARGYLDDFGRDAVQSPNIHFVDLCALAFDIVVREGHPILDTDSALDVVFQYPLACPKAPTDILSLIATSQEQAGSAYACPNILIDDYQAVFKIVEASDHWTAVPAASKHVIQRMHKLSCISDRGQIPPLRIGYATRAMWDPTPSAMRLIALIKDAVADLPATALAQ